jgi:ADP-heptose:LPS heptosyltransferase
MTLANLAPLAGIKDVEFFSLQIGEAGKQTPPAGMNLIDFTSQLADFAETAALAENMDLIITVDTSMAHLAGAMGKRAWVILPFVADWRWPRHRHDNPWYPTLRLFRQPSIGDWGGAIQKVAEQLQTL